MKKYFTATKKIELLNCQIVYQPYLIILLLLLNFESGVLGQAFLQSTVSPFNNQFFMSRVIDFDNDGDEDVIGWNGQLLRSTKLYKNNGNSQFTDVSVQSNFPSNNEGICADLDRNGYTDVYYISGDTLIFSLNQNGVFTTPNMTCGKILLSSIFGSSNLRSVKLGDFNNDGKYDVIAHVVNGSASTVMAKSGSWACGICGFSFSNQPAQSLLTISNPIDPLVTLADINNDGSFDLLIGSGTQTSPGSGYYNFNYSIYVNNGSGGFSLLNNSGFSVGRSLAFGSLGDFNNDGRVDIFSGAADCCVGGSGGAGTANPLYTFLSNNNGGYLSSNTAMIRATDRKYYYGATVVDLNLDSYQDVVWTSIYAYASSSSALQCYLNNGNNAFSESSSSLGIQLGTSPTPVAHTSQASTILDINNDFKPDINIQSYATYAGTFQNNYTVLNNTSNHSVKIKLDACAGLKEGWGARVSYKCGGAWKNIQHTAYATANQPFLYLGLGNATIIDSLVVQWVGGNVSTLTQIQSENFVVIHEDLGCTKVNGGVQTVSISASISQGQSYTLGTQTLTSAGTYTEVFTSAAGCDSTVTLTLAVEPLLTCNITSPATTLCAGESVNLSINSNGISPIVSDSLSLWQSGYRTGPFQAYSSNLDCSVHTESKWINIGGATNLELYTLQHRFYDRSRIYDSSNSLIWEWTGESVPQTTWYGRHHSITIASNDSIRIEFYSGYPGFCVGGLAITGLGDINPNNLIWSTGATTNSITVTPNTNTTYSCTVTQGAQTCTASVDITVNPTVTNAISATIIEGETYTLGTQTLTTAGTYTEVFTSVTGCDSTVILTLAVEPLLTCNITAPTTTLCAGESVNLSISSAGGAGSSSQLPANLQQGLVAYYPFNGNANDESGNGNNGTVNGATLTSDRFGNANAAYSFDGVSNFLSTNSPIVVGQSSRSISLWMNSNGNTSNQQQVLIDEGGNVCGSGFAIVKHNSPENIKLDIGCNFVDADAPITENEWMNIIVVYDNLMGVKIYINGVLSNLIYNSIGNFVVNSGLENSLTIGKSRIPSDGFFYFGALDEIAIFNRALSSSEIQQLYTAQSYAWNTGAITNSITVTPTSNTSYSCTVTQGNSTCTASIDITVNPAVTNAISATIIEGESYPLGTQTLTTAGTYTEVFTSAAGCDSTVTLTLAVEPLLTCNITAATTTLCAGESVNLSISTTGGAGSSAQLPANLQQGLVAYYPFNGNANDESGNGNTGTVNGATLTTDRFGIANKAYSFNGVNNYIETNFNLLNQDFTYAVWVRTNNLTYGYQLITNLGSSPFYQGRELRVETDGSLMTVIGTGSNWIHNQSSPQIQPNNWNFIVMSVSGNNVTLFNNGTQIYQGAISMIVPGVQTYRLGTRDLTPFGGQIDGKLDDIFIYSRSLSPSEIQQLYSSQSYAWNTGATTSSITVSPTTNTTYSCTVTQGAQTCTASVDITVNPTVANAISATIIEGESYTLGTQTLTTAGTYTEVFTSAAGCDSTVTLTLSVEPLLTCNITAATTTLCAGESVNLSISTTGGAGSSSQLPANLQQGLVAYYPFNGNANDESGNGNNGTVNGATLTSDRFGNFSSAYDFNGASGYIEVPNSSSLSNINELTVSVWFRVESYYYVTNFFQTFPILSKSNQSFHWGNFDLNLWQAGNEIQTHLLSKETGCTADIVENSWNHLICSINSDSTYFYLNGDLLSSVASGNFTQFSENNMPMFIGRNIQGGANEIANGQIDDILIFNRFLNGSEIQQLYTTQSYAWSTGATTNSITVSPISDTTFSCTVTSGTQTCTTSVDITVSPQQTFYADSDGDGFGNPQVVVTNCNQPAGYVTDNTDCNDNDASVYVASTETCNGLDDNCDGQVDEGLTLGSVNATSVTTALYPTCSGNALKSANLNNGTNSSIIDGNGLDLWYSMTAQYNTLRASLSAAFGDNEIRLYSYNNGCFELIETEHEVYTVSTAATGNQVLITDDLLVGQTYYIAVHNISGPMNSSAKMCFNHFVGSTCDHYYSNNTGIYPNVCTSFKAQYKGNATNYIFDILSATQNNANLNITSWSYTTTTANSVVPRLGTIFPVNMSNAAKVYTLRIPVIYAIPDAAGNYTSITANATTTCTVTLNAELPIALRAADRCPNTKTTTSSISVDRTICGAQRYEWEFTQQLPSVQSPITVLGGLNTTVFFLNNVPGMGTGKTYNVRVRPIHANGEVGNWGTAQCLKTGTAGMVLQSENESAARANNYSPRQAVALYPNPTSTGHFTLMSNSTEEEVKQIVITDITGKMVFQSQVVMNGNVVEVEFGDLATGMYLVMVGEERLRLVVE